MASRRAPKSDGSDTPDSSRSQKPVFIPCNAIRCALCDEDVPKGQQYMWANIPPKAGAKLLNADNAHLVPAWEQLPDGNVRLNFCTTCAGELVDSSMLTAGIA